MGNDEGPAEDLTWTVWPVLRRPWLSVLVAAFCLGFAYLAWQSLGSRWYAVITLVVLAGALAPHFFPTRYELCAEGVREKGLLRDRHRAWEHLHSAFERDGLLTVTGHHLVLEDLEPEALSRALRVIFGRGLVLPLPEAGADEVRVYVRAHVPLYQWSEVQQWLKTRP